ncbi:MAG: hypothetical protein AB7O48_06125 [Cyclobacteriaceae bacterium]
MSLKTKVIVGNITNLSDARYCAGMGVDLLSFPVGNASNQISLATFLEISEWVAGPSYAIEMTNDVDQDLLQKVTELEVIEYVRVKAADLSVLSTLRNKKVIVDVNASEWGEQKDAILNMKPAFLVWHSSSGELENAIEANHLVPVLFSMNAVLNTSDNFSSWPVAGIALTGTAEDKPGQKDYEALADILELLEAD